LGIKNVEIEQCDFLKLETKIVDFISRVESLLNSNADLIVFEKRD